MSSKLELSKKMIQNPYAHSDPKKLQKSEMKNNKKSKIWFIKEKKIGQEAIL